MPTKAPIRVRIAPSPTGDPHVGTAYVALFNYAYAKHHGGAFILRIEDTDRTRSTKASEDAILRSLAWLGLSWQEGPDIGGPYGPYRQSERGAIYAEHAQILLKRGEAYRCFCTAERLAQLRDQQRAAKGRFGYDGHCLTIDPATADKRAAQGEAHVIRLKMPKTGETVLNDLLRGEVRLPNEESDDQVLLKSDGMPTYHLANVVDDHLMKISHVIRAEEWISSAPKHLRLYQAFGWEPPTFAHLPLLRNADKNKSKISKRNSPVSLDYYRDTGILPHAMLNFLALMGWSFGGDREKFTLTEMVERFDLGPGAITLTGPVFDLEKLAWLNSVYLRELSDADFVDQLQTWRLGRDYLTKLVPLVRERIRKFDEFIPLTTYFFSGDLDYAPVARELIPKNRSPKDVTDFLGTLADELDTLADWSVAALESHCRTVAEREGWATKEVFMMLRVILTGRTASPGLFETMSVLGRDVSRRRVRQSIVFIKQSGKTIVPA